MEELNSPSPATGCWPVAHRGAVLLLLRAAARVAGERAVVGQRAPDVDRKPEELVEGMRLLRLGEPPNHAGVGSPPRVLYPQKLSGRPIHNRPPLIARGLSAVVGRHLDGIDAVEDASRALGARLAFQAIGHRHWVVYSLKVVASFSRASGVHRARSTGGHKVDGPRRQGRHSG